MPKDFEEKNNFDIYLNKVLKQVHPDIHITSDARISLNVMIHELARNLCGRISSLMRDGNKATVSSREVQSAIRLHMPGELAKHAVSEGTKAVTNYIANDSGTKSNPVSKVTRAGLVVPPGRVKALMKKYLNAERISESAPVYLAAVLEYSMAEILELSGNAARDSKKTRITRKHMMYAIQGDEELNALFKGTLTNGTIPHIHMKFLPRK